MDYHKLLQQLDHDEGNVLYAYQDSLGYWTIARGVCIDRRKNCGITQEESDYLTLNRIKLVVEQLSQHLSFWDRLSEARQIALADMAYELGINGLLDFKAMLAALDRENWIEAYTEALDSKWARQVPSRANRIATILKTGQLAA